MTGKRRNVILIGMPGAGKSTVGVILAKRVSLDFVDTDVLIQISEGRPLQAIVDGEGHLALREVEERLLLALDLTGHVIATGGSAVYSRRAMAHLKAGGTAVFLDTDLEVIEERLGDYGSRGLARAPDQNLADLFEERIPLYREFTDITIDCAGLDQEEVCRQIMKELEQWPGG